VNGPYGSFTREFDFELASAFLSNEKTNVFKKQVHKPNAKSVGGNQPI
jgi:hypothetical protein